MPDMNNELPPGARDEILNLIYTRQKVKACKRYVEMTGAGLRDAKRFVEQLTEELRQESPEKFAAESKSGCLGFLVLVAASFSGLLGGVALFLRPW
jgi:hypothetical protein